jgi:hypothetical protein
MRAEAFLTGLGDVAQDIERGSGTANRRGLRRVLKYVTLM